MVTTMTKLPTRTPDDRSGTTRLEIRIPIEDKKLIERAARASHWTTTAFVLQVVRSAAEDVLRRDKATVVPSDFYEAMIASLDEPAKPVEALTQVARTSREILNRK